MRVICAWCHQELEADPQYADDPESRISHGICPACKDYFLSGRRPTLDKFLDRLAVPVLVVDTEGNILLASQHALDILGKNLKRVQGYKGGEAMECAYARLPGGCGQTVHCKACTIRNSVMETFNTGQSLLRVPAYLDRRTDDGVVRIRFQISTQKVEDTVLLRIDQVSQ
jgi:transcriptional regulator with PAS, ATPase and Fis domain